MTTPQQFAKKMSGLANALPLAARSGTMQAALLAKDLINREFDQATGGDRVLSGVGKNGAKVGASFTVAGTTSPTALVRATGPAHLIERDTKAHPIKNKKRGGKKALASQSFGPVSVVSDHPGTKGKEPFGKGVTKAEGLTGKVYEREVHKTMSRFFRGG